MPQIGIAADPSALILSKGFRVELLDWDSVAFRSTSRIHCYGGRIYRGLGRALASCSPAKEFGDLVRQFGVRHVVEALQQLSNRAIVGHSNGSGDSGTPDADLPWMFGDMEAPYRTCLKFQSAAGAGTAELTSGYYVYGKGVESLSAQRGCAAEAIERRGFDWSDHRERVRLSPLQVRERAIMPTSLLPPDAAGANEMPADWTPVSSLVSGTVRYLPTAFCYFGLRGDTTRIRSDSTGCAAGTTLQEATLSGFFEVIERDAFRKWWLGTTTGHRVRVESFVSGFMAQARDYLGTIGRSLLLIDITVMPGVPVFAALSFGERGHGALGLSAHFNASTAMQGAVLELGLAVNWSKCFTCGQHGLTPALKRGPGARVASSTSLDPAKYPETSDGQGALDRAVALVHDAGLDFLLLDTTQPDSELATVRITIPGLLRFNPGLAYQLVYPECPA